MKQMLSMLPKADKRTFNIQPIPFGTVGSITIPGSKSYTNRALVIAAMTKGPVKINHPLFSDDTEAMLSCLNVLGIQYSRQTDCIIVQGDTSDIQNKEYELDARFSGTTIRFLLGLCALVPGIQVLTGGPRLCDRPIGDMVDALNSLGAQIEYVDKTGFPPLRVQSSSLQRGTVQIKGSSSSQFVSAMLMIAPLIGAIAIEITDELISKPYVDMTLEVMAHFGVTAARDHYKRFAIAAKQPYKPNDFTVEGDISSAAYFLAIAALTHSKITIHNFNPKSIQADMGILGILTQMGTTIQFGENTITVIGNGVQPITVDMENCPDQAPTVAVLAAFATGTSTLHGIQSLRVKETERVVALENELKKLGIKTTSTHSSLTIYGGQPKAAAIATYGDHRMAMAFALAGSALSGLTMKEPGVVEKTFPDFWNQYAALLNSVSHEPNTIVLIGMRGSGKSTTARMLGTYLRRPVIDLDTLIKEQQHAEVSAIVQTYGWEYFREGIVCGRNELILPGCDHINRWWCRIERR